MKMAKRVLKADLIAENERLKREIEGHWIRRYELGDPQATSPVMAIRYREMVDQQMTNVFRNGFSGMVQGGKPFSAVE